MWRADALTRELGTLTGYRASSTSERIRGLIEMPALAIGTALPTILVRGVIAAAIKLGYRHIDLAFRYAHMSFIEGMPSNRPDEYFREVREGFSEGMIEAVIRREDMWITLKAPDLEEALEKFGLEYVDVFIPSQVDVVSASPKVRNWGVENLPGDASVPDEIRYVQLQANRMDDIQRWIAREKHVQLFSAVSALHNGEPYLVTVVDRESVVRYLLARFVYRKGNTLIVGTQTGASLQRNIAILSEVEAEDGAVRRIDELTTFENLPHSIRR
jgi:diketogulonate reductase-like aldo/keto reductase